MIGSTLLGCGATLVALLAAGAAQGGEAVVQTAQGRVPAATTTDAAESERPRVAPGVLVRATSRRAQRREASAAREEPAARAPDADTIESIEIDWNASGATP